MSVTAKGDKQDQAINKKKEQDNSAHKQKNDRLWINSSGSYYNNILYA